jgi:protein-disulfide isomerase
MNVRAALLPLLLVLSLAACPAPTPPPAAAAGVAASAGAGTTAPFGGTPGAPSGKDAAPSEATAAVPVRSHNATWGSRTALVTIVEFSDFQCPYCQRALATLARVREAYGPDTVRLVWKNYPLPFHEQARPAAEAAMGVLALAGVDAFWRFHDLAFRNQSLLGHDAYEAWARLAGVTDIDAWHNGLSKHLWAGATDTDLEDARALGVNGTPMFFLNGVALSGAQPYEAFQAIIDDQVRAARAKLAAGVAPAAVYAELAKENRAKAPPPANDDDDEPEDTKTVYRVPVGRSPSLGNPAAPVTIVEFSDFQCPFCGRVQPTLQALREKYGADLRLVWKNLPLPFHPWAEPAAQAALEVRAERGDAAFWQMHDAIFARQADLSEDVLVDLAAAAGARPAAVRAAIQKHSHAREIDADADLADDFHADGTPHFFINGRRLVGARPQEKFQAIVDEEIKKAKELVAKGTRPADVYDALTKDGSGPPPPETKDVPSSLPAHDPERGARNARVTVHIWSDFQCPFCGRVEPTLGRLMKEYGDRAKLVWHDLPLPMHPDAPLAAQAAREAYAQKGAAAFWEMHDKMFADQQKLKRDDLDADARELHLNVDRWKAALDGGTHAAEVDADAKAAADLGITGTPAFLVVPAGKKTGYYVSGAQPYGRFRRVVERALAEAK